MEVCYDFEQERTWMEDVGRTSVNVALFFFALAPRPPRPPRRNLNGRWSLPFTIRFAVMHLFPRGCFSLARLSVGHALTPLHSVMMRH